MIDYTACILYLYPNAVFSTEGLEYSGIHWDASNAQPMPTQETLDAAWPAAQAAAASQTSNAATLQQQAADALVSLRAYRDLASPTNAQTVAAVKLLCKVAIGLIRMRLGKFDGTD